MDKFYINFPGRNYFWKCRSKKKKWWVVGGEWWVVGERNFWRSKKIRSKNFRWFSFGEPYIKKMTFITFWMMRNIFKSVAKVFHLNKTRPKKFSCTSNDTFHFSVSLLCNCSKINYGLRSKFNWICLSKNFSNKTNLDFFL